MANKDCLSFCSFPIDHCIVCPSIYGFRLFVWHLQTFLTSYCKFIGMGCGFLTDNGQHFGYIMGISFIGGDMVFNFTFNNISVISWWSVI